MTQLFNLYPTAKLTVVTGLLVLLPDLARAQAPHCNVLKGAYAFTASGTAVFPGNPAPVPFTWVGIQTFDGAGKWSLLGSTNFSGFIQRSVPLSGTYILNPDCSGTMSTVFPDGSIRLSDIAVSRRGKTIYGVGVADVGPGNMLALTATRID